MGLKAEKPRKPEAIVTATFISMNLLLFYSDGGVISHNFHSTLQPLACNTCALHVCMCVIPAIRVGGWVGWKH